MSAEGTHSDGAAVGFVLGPFVLIGVVLYMLAYGALIGYLLCVLAPIVVFPLVGAINWIGRLGLFRLVPDGFASGAHAPWTGLGAMALVVLTVAALAFAQVVLWRWRVFRLATWIAWFMYLHGLLFLGLGMYLGGVRLAWMPVLWKRLVDLNFDITPFVAVLVGTGLGSVHVPYLMATGQLSAVAIERVTAPLLWATAIVVVLNLLLYRVFRRWVWRSRPPLERPVPAEPMLLPQHRVQPELPFPRPPRAHQKR